MREILRQPHQDFLRLAALFSLLDHWLVLSVKLGSFAHEHVQSLVWIDCFLGVLRAIVEFCCGLTGRYAAGR